MPKGETFPSLKETQIVIEGGGGNTTPAVTTRRAAIRRPSWAPWHPEIAKFSFTAAICDGDPPSMHRCKIPVRSDLYPPAVSVNKRVAT